MLAFGVTSIICFGTAPALALALATANVIASLPCLLQCVTYVWRHASFLTAVLLFRYGWPLLLAFGVSALAHNIDRLLLAAWVGTRELGPYGASADLIKQTFFVFGESIALAFVSLAKRSAAVGDHGQASEVLEMTFNSLFTVAAFGTAFFVSFGPFVFNLAFGPEFARASSNYVPILVLANVFVMLRAFYSDKLSIFPNPVGWSCGCPSSRSASRRRYRRFSFHALAY